jgi:hypothetical protein
VSDQEYDALSSRLLKVERLIYLIVGLQAPGLLQLVGAI